MSSTTLFCAGCGRLVVPGAALRVISRDGRWFPIHRPFVDGGCLRAAGSVAVTRIEMFDEGAAVAFDHARKREAA
jgi:hypothetical protein